MTSLPPPPTMMITTTTMTMTTATTMTMMMTRVSQLWDLIEIWGFREDINDMIAAADNNNNDNDNYLYLNFQARSPRFCMVLTLE